MKIDKKLFKNYLLLQTAKMPTDPKIIFLPFVANVILIKRIFSANYEKLSNEFEDYYGFKLPFFIFKDILSYMLKRKMCEKTTSNYEFKFSSLSKVVTFDEKQIEQFNSDINDLIDNLERYIDDEKIKRNEIVNVLNKFIDNNDYSILNSESSYNYEDKAILLYLVEFIKEGKQKQNSDYRTILKMCEGNLIRSFIFDKVNPKDIYKGTKVFIDTPIVFRLLGYYGEYIKNEYEFLFNSWKEQGGNFYIYSHNYDECIKILRSTQDFVERKQIDILKASDVCIYFREKEYTSEDIELIIANFRDKLLSYDIREFEIDFNKNQENMIDSEEIRDNILEEYNRNINFDNQFFDSQRANFVEIDVKSIVYSYFLRKKNNIHSFKECNLIFLTNNKGLYYSARKYQKEHFGDTISPLQLDSFIGKVICANNLGKITQITENRIISHCISAFNPNYSLKEKFSNRIEKMKENDSITEKDYYMLKNYKIINEELVKKTKGNPDNLTEDTIYDFLSTVKAEMISEERKKHENEKEKIISQYQNDIEKEKLKYEKYTRKNIEEKEKKAQDRQEKYRNAVQRDYNKAKKNLQFILLIFLLIILLIFVFMYIDKIIRYSENDIIYMIINIILFLMNVFYIISYVKNKSNYIDLFLKRYRLKLEKKYRDIL